MAGHHRELIENTNFWAHPVVAQALNTNLQRIAKEAVVDDPTVSPKRLEEADATVRYLLPAIQSADTELPQWISLGMFWAVVIFAALLDFACALIMGEGLFLRLLGIATVNRNGDKASRIRVLWRTILAWSPCGIGAPLSLALWLTLVPGLHVNFFVMIALGVMILLTLGTLAWAIWRPARGLQDIAAGTWLVPS